MGRQPLARVPLVARERIFHGTSGYFTHMPNLHYKRARRTRKLKLSTMHEINSLKISQGCNAQYNIYVVDICSGPAIHIHHWFTVKAKKKLAQGKPVYSNSHEHKQIRLNKGVRRRKNES